jgi:hypothetical protein
MSRIAPTYAEFIVLFPAFAAAALQPIVESELSLSARMLDVGVWDDFFSDAIGLEVAHNLAIRAIAAGPGGLAPTGQVSNVSGAGISIGFATPSGSGKSRTVDWYNRTNYGQQFLTLRDRVVPMGMLAT